MPATVRYDEQYCPIARALDVLGDRWTLLILRELVIGDQRFTDLRDHLPGIAPTLLSQRLRSMAEQDLLASKELPPPAARSVYTITERGRAAVPVMRALARWGVPLLEEPAEDQEIRSWTAINGTVATFYDPVAAAGVDERYLFRVGGDEVVLSSVKGGGTPRDTPDLVIEGPARVWIDIRQGRTTLHDAIDHGVVTVDGSATALANFQRIYRLA
ncbi:MAG: transcriptional regulator, HxlR family [Ilumatobacteraceae bacterium]|nr:transcriptional regulator, HxlR family [Ilumatobacteraceae bacterium]